MSTENEFNPDAVERYEQDFEDCGNMKPSPEGYWVRFTDYSKLRELYRDSEQASSYGQDCDGMLMIWLDAPLCPTHNKHCWAHFTAWLVAEMKRLREIEELYRSKGF